MSARRADVPKLDWPEDRAASDGDDVAIKVLTVFRDCCGAEVVQDNLALLFVPDPPVPEAPEDWARANGMDPSGWGLRKLTVGPRGLAWIATGQDDRQRMIAIFLSLRSTTLSIIAVPGAMAGDTTALRRTIDDFLGDEAEKFPYAALFFDYGVLMSYERQR